MFVNALLIFVLFFVLDDQGILVDFFDGTNNPFKGAGGGGGGGGGDGGGGGGGSGSGRGQSSIVVAEDDEEEYVRPIPLQLPLLESLLP